MVKTSCTLCKARRCEEPLNFFTVPKNEHRRDRWVQSCGKELKDSAKICSRHFLDKDFIEPPGPNKRARLYPNAVPKVGLTSKPKILRLNPIASMTPPKSDPMVSRLLSNRKSLSVSVTHIAKTKTEKTPITPNNNLSSESKEMQLFAHELVKVCMDHKKNTGLVRGYRMSGFVNVHGKVCFDSTSQTDDGHHMSSTILENMDLKKKVRKLEVEIEKLKQEAKNSHCITQSLSNIFTEGQLRKLKCPDRFIHWSRDDITSATNLHAAGHNAYMYLYRQGFPLPSIATLKKWSQKRRRLEKELLEMSADVMTDKEDFIEEQEEEEEEVEEEEDLEKEIYIIQPQDEIKLEYKLLSDDDNEKPTTSKCEKPKTGSDFDKHKKYKKIRSNSEKSSNQPYEEIKIEEEVLSSDCTIPNLICIPVTMDMIDKEDLSDDEKISVHSFDELKTDEVVLSCGKMKVKEENTIIFPHDLEEFLL